MDSKKLTIRPVLNFSSEIPIEDFQNKTVRPILKLQHDLLLQFFIFFCNKQKVDILNVEKEKFNKVVNNITKKNINLKNQFLGLIIGQFTVGEFEFYKENNTDINKRILMMIGQRIKDSQLEIKDFKTNNNDNSTKN
ncbi:glyoxalase [Tenacibaculum retecalamus]|uniref:glyoxalase n=1 Tax=Tenacibaculum retecalamus TaxID=3018315 RepID=UPI0023D903B5|nr:glyoxalase [Tenacibaculum retecalamus]WBX72183.1 glyoxalase [Tenacibaculum retecalamus]